MENIISSETRIFRKGDAEYQANAYQYAKSSHEGMSPNMIIYPTGLEEILNIVNFAKKNRVGVAVRTGGHQYSGKILKTSSFEIYLAESKKKYQKCVSPQICTRDPSQLPPF